MTNHHEDYEPARAGLAGRRQTDLLPVKTNSWQAAGVVLAFAINFFALVWGAAMMSSGLAGLEKAVGKVEVIAGQLSDQISRLNERQAVLEYKVEDLKKQEDRLNVK